MPLSVTGTLKLVLRDLPDVHEQDGLVHLALTNEPRGLPAGLTLAPSPLALACAVKQWRTACTKAEQVRATGLPALFIIEAHVGVQDSSLVGLVKGIQIVPGKAPTATPE
jgi:hypothetical protein